MTIQHIVPPAKIESALLQLWEEQGREKTRACLFNLIVFNELSVRTDYFRTIVQQVSEKYPCRVLFITLDPNAPSSLLKTAVSIVGKSAIACDYIDIGTSFAKLEEVPFLLWAHLLPDLPISLLWTEDPSKPHPLFAPLAKLSSRIIFDSESASDLPLFAKTILQLQKTHRFDIADLNWARTEGWRELLSSLFHSQEKLDLIRELHITYNNRPSESFCHLQVQSLYLLGWLASRLNWKFNTHDRTSFHFSSQLCTIHSTHWEKLGSGSIISVDLDTSEKIFYQCGRNPQLYHQVTIQISSPTECKLPYRFMLGKTATGHSLVQEIIVKGTSRHYLDMLYQMENLC